MATYLVLENLDGIMGLIVIIFHIIISIYVFRKMRYPLLLMVNLMFSIFLSWLSFSYDISMTPYIQIFDILINAIFLVYSIEQQLKKRG